MTGESSGIELIDAVGTDLIRSVQKTLTEFSLQQHALPGCEARIERRIVIGSDRPVERRFDAKPVGRHRAEARHQESGFALHGRIGSRKVRQISHRNAEELELRVLEIQHLLLLIVNDTRALDLPKWRLLRIVLTRSAGCINAVLKNRVVAAGAVGARGSHSRRIGGVNAQRIDEAVPVVVAQIHDVRIGDLAVRIGHADVAFGMQPLGFLIVDDLVSLDACSIVEHLHVADRGDPRIIVVVIDLDSLDEHLSVVGRAHGRRPGRSGIVGKALRRGGARKAQRAGKQYP